MVVEPKSMHTSLVAARRRLFQRSGLPDLESQLEELLVEVWRQEDFERKHPFTCAVIRDESIRAAERGLDRGHGSDHRGDRQRSARREGSGPDDA